MHALSTLFEQFPRERRYLKNVTPKTIIWYQTAFLALTRTVTLSAPSDLSKPLLHEFVVGLRERGLSPVSCNTYVKALNSFFAWLHAEGHLRDPLTVTPNALRSVSSKRCPRTSYVGCSASNPRAPNGGPMRWPVR